MSNRPAAYTFYERGWMVRVQPPDDQKSRHVLLMLHGWTGDENVMSIFAKKIPDSYWLISPRGPVKADPVGYGWFAGGSPKNAKFSDYAIATDELDRQVNHWLEFLRISTNKISIMGFSQGGAMALCYLLRFPDQVERVTCLAGFLPASAEEGLNSQSLSGKPVFFGHGSLDETIPIVQAQSAATVLRSLGAEVVFCQDEVGHKLGSECFNSLEAFFALQP